MMWNVYKIKREPPFVEHTGGNLSEETQPLRKDNLMHGAAFGSRTLTMRLLCKLKKLTRYWRKFYENLEFTWFMLLQIALATSCYCVVWAPRGWRGNERKTWLKSDAQMVWCNLPCVKIINGKWTQRCFAVNAAHLLRRLNHGSSGKDCRGQNCKASTKSIRHRRCHKILISWSANRLAGSKTA